MLLTKSEQKKLRLYIIKRMKSNYRSIEKQLSEVDEDASVSFIYSLLHENYKICFDYCINWLTIRYEEDFMDTIEHIIMPDVMHQVSKYHVFESDQDDNSERWDKLDNEIKRRLNELSDELFE